jgi:Zn-dependent M28 family amino/carboxypeptidase
MPRRRLPLLLLLAAAPAALVPRCADHPTAPPAAGVEGITAAAVRGLIEAVAHDSMLGRMTPSPELKRMAAYAAARFQAAGLAPALPSGYRQEWPLGADTASNVAAVLPGSDPSLAGEYVLLVAHMDHIGTVGRGHGCSPAGADTICNGADDNASGTAAVLALAEAYAGRTPRPRRSLLFLLVSGEEEGLLGSVYYVQHPAVPLAQTVAALNFDMISRNAPDSILVAGTDGTTLGPLVTATADSHAELGIHPVDVPWPLGSSDHIPFGAAGIPTLLFHSGLHADYHRPTDEVERIDADKTARVVRLAYHLVWTVAQAAVRPTAIAGGAAARAAGEPR